MNKTARALADMIRNLKESNEQLSKQSAHVSHKYAQADTFFRALSIALEMKGIDPEPLFAEAQKLAQEGRLEVKEEALHMLKSANHSMGTPITLADRDSSQKAPSRHAFEQALLDMAG